jgi:uncharacterized protein YsxB (DUF464 family)
LIEIKIHKKQGLFVGLSSTGHASRESGLRGENLVCAGVSTLLQTLFLYLKKEKIVEKSRLNPGELEFTLSQVRNPKLSILIDQAFQMTILGLESLQKDHPESILLQFLEDEEDEEKKRAVS